MDNTTSTSENNDIINEDTSKNESQNYSRAKGQKQYKDLRELLNEKRQQKSEHFKKNGPPSEPRYNFLADPLRDNNYDLKIKNEKKNEPTFGSGRFLSRHNIDNKNRGRGRPNQQFRGSSSFRRSQRGRSSNLSDESQNVEIQTGGASEEDEANQQIKDDAGENQNASSYDSHKSYSPHQHRLHYSRTNYENSYRKSSDYHHIKNKNSHFDSRRNDSQNFTQNSFESSQNSRPYFDSRRHENQNVSQKNQEPSQHYNKGPHFDSRRHDAQNAPQKNFDASQNAARSSYYDSRRYDHQNFPQRSLDPFQSTNRRYDNAHSFSQRNADSQNPNPRKQYDYSSYRNSGPGQSYRNQHFDSRASRKHISEKEFNNRPQKSRYYFTNRGLKHPKNHSPKPDPVNISVEFNVDEGTRKCTIQKYQISEDSEVEQAERVKELPKIPDAEENWDDCDYVGEENYPKQDCDANPQSESIDPESQSENWDSRPQKSKCDSNIESENGQRENIDEKFVYEKVEYEQELQSEVLEPGNKVNWEEECDEFNVDVANSDNYNDGDEETYEENPVGEMSEQKIEDEITRDEALQKEPNVETDLNTGNVENPNKFVKGDEINNANKQEEKLSGQKFEGEYTRKEIIQKQSELGDSNADIVKNPEKYKDGDDENKQEGEMSTQKFEGEDTEKEIIQKQSELNYSNGEIVKNPDKYKEGDGKNDEDKQEGEMTAQKFEGEDTEKGIMQKQSELNESNASILKRPEKYKEGDGENDENKQDGDISGQKFESKDTGKEIIQKQSELNESDANIFKKPDKYKEGDRENNENKQEGEMSGQKFEGEVIEKEMIQKQSELNYSNEEIVKNPDKYKEGDGKKDENKQEGEISGQKSEVEDTEEEIMQKQSELNESNASILKQPDKYKEGGGENYEIKQEGEISGQKFESKNTGKELIQKQSEPNESDANIFKKPDKYKEGDRENNENKQEGEMSGQKFEGEDTEKEMMQIGKNLDKYKEDGKNNENKHEGETSDQKNEDGDVNEATLPTETISEEEKKKTGLKEQMAKKNDSGQKFKEKKINTKEKGKSKRTEEQAVRKELELKVTEPEKKVTKTQNTEVKSKCDQKNMMEKSISVNENKNVKESITVDENKSKTDVKDEVKTEEGK